METPKDINVWKIVFLCLLVVAVVLALMIYNQSNEVEIGPLKINEKTLSDIESNIDTTQPYSICSIRDDVCMIITQLK